MSSESASVGETARGTFGVEPLVHIRMVLLEPFPALLRRAAELAILGGRISLWSLAGDSSRAGGGPGRGTSGGREQTTKARQRGRLHEARMERMYRRSRRRVELGAPLARHLWGLLRPWCVGDGRSRVGGWVVGDGVKVGGFERWVCIVGRSDSLFCAVSKDALHGGLHQKSWTPRLLAQISDSSVHTDLGSPFRK